jgi:hypothetical protein
LLQLQQLGLPSGFRSGVYWWQEALSPNRRKYARQTEYPGGADRHEKINFGRVHRKGMLLQGRRQDAQYA